MRPCVSNPNDFSAEVIGQRCYNLQDLSKTYPVSGQPILPFLMAFQSRIEEVESLGSPFDVPRGKWFGTRISGWSLKGCAGCILGRPIPLERKQKTDHQVGVMNHRFPEEHARTIIYLFF